MVSVATARATDPTLLAARLSESHDRSRRTDFPGHLAQDVVLDAPAGRGHAARAPGRVRREVRRIARDRSLRGSSRPVGRGSRHGARLAQTRETRVKGEWSRRAGEPRRGQRARAGLATGRQWTDSRAASPKATLASATDATRAVGSDPADLFWALLDLRMGHEARSPGGSTVPRAAAHHCTSP